MKPMTLTSKEMIGNIDLHRVYRSVMTTINESTYPPHNVERPDLYKLALQLAGLGPGAQLNC
jgi:hypothetical protein